MVAEGAHRAAEILKHVIIARKVHSVGSIKLVLQSLYAAVVASHDVEWKKVLSVLCSVDLHYTKAKKVNKEAEYMTRMIRILLDIRLTLIVAARLERISLSMCGM